MEFTISRVVLCICGVVILASITGVITGIYDIEVSDQDDRLVQRIGYMLDVFETSDVGELILDGSAILPSGYYLNVHDGFVELTDGKSRHLALTSYDSEFSLGYDDVVTVTHRTFQLSSRPFHRRYPSLPDCCTDMSRPLRCHRWPSIRRRGERNAFPSGSSR